MILLDYWLFGRTACQSRSRISGALAAFTRAFLTDTIIKPKSENLAGSHSLEWWLSKSGQMAQKPRNNHQLFLL